MSGLATAIQNADEAYLTALANKGLYKRAVRELPDAGITLNWAGEKLSAQFADGTEVTVEESIQGYTCSCPSRSVCKHLLMAVLAAQQQAGSGGEGGEQAKQAPPDFSPLLELKPEILQKLAGKKAFAGAVFAVQTASASAAIEEASTLGITLPDNGFTVRFLPGTAVEDCRCDCKAAGFCGHKVQAVLHYMVHRLNALPEAFLPKEQEVSVEFSTYTVPHIRTFVEEVLSTGLARLPQDMGGRFTQLSTICHSQRLANLERLCNRIAGQLELLEAKSAAFRRDELLGNLCMVLEQCTALEGGSRDPKTVGVFREQYSPIPTVDLLGLGCYGWQSTGGYTGITTLFYCPSLSKMMTYTTALPLDQNPRLDRMYHSGAPWGLPTKLSAVSQATLSLRGGKASLRGQLSSSSEAVAQVTGKTDPMCPELAPVRFDDFNHLLEAVWRHGEQEEGPFYAVVLPARYGPCRFDKITQILELPVYDSAERRLNIQVRYEAVTRLLLENLMGMDDNGRLRGPLTARISLEKGRLTAYPLAFPAMEQGNVSLDKEKHKTGKRQLVFDWEDV